MKQRHVAALALMAALCGASGCSSYIKSTVNFRCDSQQINGGLLLTVDVVHGTQADAERVRALGEKWFYDSQRNALGERLQTITFPTTDPTTGACEKQVAIKASKDSQFLIVAADYKYENQQTERQILVLKKQEWWGRKVKIGVHDRALSKDSK
jgi:predicted component of type VI protein secretion system